MGFLSSRSSRESSPRGCSPRRAELLLPALVTGLGIASAAAETPTCIERQGGETTRGAVARSKVPELELLGRLVYAETVSTGFPDDPRVASAIAWGVMNRVRLVEAHPRLERSYGAGISGVVFKEGQFNPAVSSRSRFSGDFLCPRHDARWETAMDAARKAWAGDGNPFIDTEWELEHGLSLVVNFYYPASEQARDDVAPWEGDGRLRFIGDVELDGGVLPADRVRFYRLVSPPGP